MATVEVNQIPVKEEAKTIVSNISKSIIETEASATKNIIYIIFFPQIMTYNLIMSIIKHIKNINHLFELFVRVSILFLQMALQVLERLITQKNIIGEFVNFVDNFLQFKWAKNVPSVKKTVMIKESDSGHSSYIGGGEDAKEEPSMFGKHE